MRLQVLGCSGGIGGSLGGPLVGAITTHFGARTGMAVCGLVPLLAGLAIAGIHLRTVRAVRLRAA